MISTKDGTRSIIAISGKQLSGKDYVAKLWLEMLPNFRRVGLGDAIKMEFASIHNLSISELEQNKHLYRPDLIALGNYGRGIDHGLFWIKKVLEVRGNLIVPDIRVQSEFKAFKKLGAIMVRVEADRKIRAARGTLVKEEDPTECALDNILHWDLVIHNNSTLENLKEQAQQIYQFLPQDVLTG